MGKDEKEMADAGKLFGFFRDTLQAAIESAGALKFDKTHKWHMGLITLYGTILELSNSIRVLVENDSSIGIPILLRSQLEAFLDFINLANDRSYGYYIDAAHLKEWIKILEEAKLTTNPYLAEISSLPNLDELLEDQRAKFLDLKRKGYGPLKQYEKFDKSTLTQTYTSVYNFLCCDTHNNMRSLISRHTEISDDQSDFQVKYFTELDLVENLQYIDSSLGILVESTQQIHRALTSPKATEVESLTEKLHEIRKPWIG